jgi:fluoroacetyl-CoA thioesterase
MKMQNLFVGTEHRKQFTVTNAQSDEAWGGNFNVLSSPSLIGNVEMICAEAIYDQLDIAHTTVGVKFDFLHLAPTPVGRAVEIVAKLSEIDDKMLTFTVEANDIKTSAIVFKGTHRRAVVERSAFFEKVRTV